MTKASLFAELVCNIHLNPLLAGIVNTPSDAYQYRYCDHSVIMGKKCLEWQDGTYVLNYGERTEEKAGKDIATRFKVASIGESGRTWLEDDF